MIKAHMLKNRISKITLCFLATVGLLAYRSTICSLDPLYGVKQLATLAKTSVCLPYNLTQWYILKNNPELSAYYNAQQALNQPFPPATETYKKLSKETDPFLVSIGTSMSQTKTTTNVIHPNYLGQLLWKKAQSQKNPTLWLTDRWGYVVRSTANIECNNCKKTVDFALIQQHDKMVNIIAKDLIDNPASTLTLSKCPFCSSKDIIQLPKSLSTFTKDDQEALLKQLECLGVFNQYSTQVAPSYRLSGELADFLSDSGEIDIKKLREQAEFAQKLHYPLYFFHHYANPTCKPHLFEHTEDIAWFANICAEFIKACPGLTHVCPISQIMGFGLQVARQKTLPPFSCNIDTNLFLQNIVAAQVAASKAMKKINPKLKVLVSHQWKPFKPLHSFGDPRHALETAVCNIADRMYNQTFIQLMQNNQDSFDGIALSIYPALYFNLITPQGNNCNGIIDAQAALEAIFKIYKAFPGKEIHIVETGCNTNDPEIKKKFVDMTLYVCQLAREMGIPVKSCYFWGQVNNPYFEWNKNPGSSFFGPFETLSTDSINSYGTYLQEILKQR